MKEIKCEICGSENIKLKTTEGIPEKEEIFYSLTIAIVLLGSIVSFILLIETKKALFLIMFLLMIATTGIIFLVLLMKKPTLKKTKAKCKKCNNTWIIITDRKTKETITTINNQTNENDKKNEYQKTYIAKDNLLTECEKIFFEKLKKLFNEKYIVQPQINLATIIKKESTDKYINELFRNIDFGIFNKEYKLLILIELNDSSHLEPKRYERDKKVKEITQAAQIPLITFWTDKPNEENYIYNRIINIISKEK
ncbi:MAG: DUF2726 domain-containing protein [Clostridiales bacterium]|jgi:hypothetical protein|nr:DUF2726 domain-containing protein [Clostridiales bacterium]